MTACGSNFWADFSFREVFVLFIHSIESSETMMASADSSHVEQQHYILICRNGTSGLIIIILNLLEGTSD